MSNEKNLNQAINKATAGCIMQSERPANRLFGLGSRWLTCGEYISTDDTLALLRALDVDAVSNAAAKYLVEPPKGNRRVGQCGVGRIDVGRPRARQNSHDGAMCDPISAR